MTRRAGLVRFGLARNLQADQNCCFLGASMEVFGTKGICDWLLENFRIKLRNRMDKC